MIMKLKEDMPQTQPIHNYTEHTDLVVFMIRKQRLWCLGKGQLGKVFFVVSSNKGKENNNKNDASVKASQKPVPCGVNGSHQNAK